jgi:hypothetical protein
MALNDYALASIVLTIHISCMLFVFIVLKWLASTLMCRVCVTEWKSYLWKLYLDMWIMKFSHWNFKSLSSIDISTGMSF